MEKSAIITGAGSGIGKEIALRFAAEGGIAAIADLNLDAAKESASEIKGKGGSAFAVAMNVADENAVNTGVAEVRRNSAELTCSSATLASRSSSLSSISPLTSGRSCSRFHLDGAFLTTKACLKPYVCRQSGSIIYMVSGASKEASRLKAPYVTAKHGLIGLCKVVAKEGAEVQCARECGLSRLCSPPRSSTNKYPNKRANCTSPNNR